MWLVVLLYISGLTSMFLWGHELYRSIKCDKVPQFSCRNEKCFIRHRCLKYRLSDTERQKLQELLDKMD